MLNNIANIRHFPNASAVQYLAAMIDDTGKKDIKPIINTLRPRQNGRHLTADISKFIPLNSVKTNYKFIPKVQLETTINIGPVIG